MEITIDMIKELREATAAGILNCRKALEASEGDFDKAVDYLREKGLAKVAKRMDREANEGIVDAYIHGENRIGVLLEVNCETDFVARTPEFRALVHDIAMQIAALAPRYVSREDVPESVIQHESDLYRAQALEEGKPEHILDRIIEGKVEKFYQQICLLEQPFIRDDSVTVDDLLKEQMTKTGENMMVRRFTRYELGESLEA